MILAVLLFKEMKNRLGRGDFTKSIVICAILQTLILATCVALPLDWILDDGGTAENHNATTAMTTMTTMTTMIPTTMNPDNSTTTNAFDDFIHQMVKWWNHPWFIPEREKWPIGIFIVVTAITAYLLYALLFVVAKWDHKRKNSAAKDGGGGGVARGDGGRGGGESTNQKEKRKEEKDGRDTKVATVGWSKKKKTDATDVGGAENSSLAEGGRCAGNGKSGADNPAFRQSLDSIPRNSPKAFDAIVPSSGPPPLPTTAPPSTPSSRLPSSSSSSRPPPISTSAPPSSSSYASKYSNNSRSWMAAKNMESRL